MRRIIALFCLMLVCSGGALADMPVKLSDELTNKTLLSAVKDTAYEGYTLYQPTSRENLSFKFDKETLKNYDYIPIIAVRNEEVTLILLERDGNRWKIGMTNENALYRNGFRLVGFSMDERYSKVNQTRAYFRYVENSEDSSMTFELLLSMSKLYQNRFDQIQITPQKEQDYLFADACSIIFSNGRGMRYNYTYADSQNRLEYAIDNGSEQIYGTAGEFDLEHVPLTLYESMREYTVQGEQDMIPVKLYPDWNASTLTEVERGTHIKGETSTHGFKYREWILVSVGGQLGYLHQSFVKLDL